MSLEAKGRPGEGVLPRDGTNSGVRRIDVADLLLGNKEAVIVHNGEEYRLRITSNGRLILTK